MAAATVQKHRPPNIPPEIVEVQHMSWDVQRRHRLHRAQNKQRGWIAMTPTHEHTASLQLCRDPPAHTTPPSCSKPVTSPELQNHRDAEQGKPAARTPSLPKGTLPHTRTSLHPPLASTVHPQGGPHHRRELRAINSNRSFICRQGRAQSEERRTGAQRGGKERHPQHEQPGRSQPGIWLPPLDPTPPHTFVPETTCRPLPLTTPAPKQ